jgi:hypothetical protein
MPETTLKGLNTPVFGGGMTIAQFHPVGNAMNNDQRKPPTARMQSIGQLWPANPQQQAGTWRRRIQ